MNREWEATAEPIPGYRLIDRLGRGGFGEVWTAEAPGGLIKAIKFVFGTLTETVETSQNHAEQELKALSRIRGIRHPFILSLERFDVINGQLMIVMELADRNLDDRLRECQKSGLPGIPRAELLKYLGEAAEALDLMNTDYDLQHLDIKPQNLFLVRSHIKVADFGLVKDLEGASAKVTGGVTALYAPPETFEGWVSRNSDQYSLAIVYQEMLTGRRPFAGPSARQLMMQHLLAEPEVSLLPPCDQPIVRQALAKDPNQRFSSCSEFIDQLAHAGKTGSSLSVHFVNSELPATHEPLTPAASEEDNLSTQLKSDLKVHRSSVSTAVHSTPFLGQGSFQADAEGILVPTLVVGIGETGIRCLERMRSRLFPADVEPAAWPPVRLLGVDSDPHVLRKIEKSSRLTPESFDQLVLCRLQKPTAYFQKWDELKHLSPWLDPNYLFQISAAGGTNGYRSLGRLALVDHYHRISARLHMELEELMSPASLHESMSARGETLRAVEPRVYVVAGMGGGTGSGMFVDLCYLVRQVLSAAGSARPDVHGVLIAGVGGASRSRDLSRINHYALAQNLLDLSGPNAMFSAKYAPEASEHRVIGSPVSSVVVFDSNSEGVPEPKLPVVIDSVAEFLGHATLTPFGRRLDETANSERWPPFRSAGWFALSYPARGLLRYTSARLCHRLVTNWMEPIASRAGEEISNAAEASLVSAGFDPASVGAQLLEACNGNLAEPVEQMIADRIERFSLDCHSPAAKRREALDLLLESLAGLLGPDPEQFDSGSVADPLFLAALHTATNQVAEAMLGPLMDALAQTVDFPGPRLERARATWEGFLHYLLRVIDVQQEMARASREKVLRRSREAQAGIAGVAAKGDPSLVPPLLRLLFLYSSEKVEFRVREKVAQVSLVLRGKLADRSRELVTFRQNLEELLANCRTHWEQAAQLGAHYCEQPLFPGGSLTLTDAADRLYQQFCPDRLDDMEAFLQEAALSPMGGLWKACTGKRAFDGTLAEAMISQGMDWISDSIPPTDVAQAFLDRHGDDHSGRAQELLAFYAWAVPSVVGRPPKNASEPAGHEALFVTAPAGPGGEEFVQAFIDAVPDVHPIVTEDRDKVAICRIQSHPSFGRLLPMWVIKSKPIYEAACHSRLTPEIFPELAGK